MSKNTFTPEESLLLIAKTIEETKNKFKENGHILMFWGFLMLFVTLSQYILYQLEFYKTQWYPVFLYPLGGIYTWIYAFKESKKMPATIIGDIVGWLGGLIGVNLMLLGFFFIHKLGLNAGPVFLLLFAIFLFVTGMAIRFKPLIISGILLNLWALSAFYTVEELNYLIMSIGSLALIIPGIMLHLDYRREHV